MLNWGWYKHEANAFLSSAEQSVSQQQFKSQIDRVRSHVHGARFTNAGFVIVNVDWALK